jgi:hypothetical protein
MLGEFQMIDDCKECTWLVKAWLIIQVRLGRDLFVLVSNTHSCLP